MPSRRHVIPTLATLTAVMALTGLAACVHKTGTVAVAPVETSRQTHVSSPVRAHLSDGTVVVFPTGVTLSGDTLHGSGSRYGLDLAFVGNITAVPLDDVVGLESYQGEETVNTGLSVISTVGVAVLAVGGMVAIACAADPKCFGSCPTVYTRSEDDGEFLLEAEAFSYSIAPLLEGRDVDVLAASPEPDGLLELELRNEALETHYLNHLELLEVRHGAHETVLPDEQGRPLVLGAMRAPLGARDRAGRDVTGILVGARDDAVYATSEAVVRAASAEDLEDHVELVFERPAGVDSVAVAFRMRNSLLNTLLFYEFMLGRGGIHAVDWLGGDLETIGAAVELGRWYRSRLGLRVSVEDGPGYREVVRIGDSGPIAWKEVAVMVPVPAGEGPLRIRISSLADEWRIDRVALAAEARREAGRVVPLAAVLDRDGEADHSALDGMSEPDEAYHVTGPGYHGTLRFRADPAPTASERTFLLASQGYYTEWIRPAWIRSASRSEPFRPEDTTLEELLVEWRVVKDELEERFYATRIPVR